MGTWSCSWPRTFSSAGCGRARPRPGPRRGARLPRCDRGRRGARRPRARHRAPLHAIGRAPVARRRGGLGATGLTALGALGQGATVLAIAGRTARSRRPLSMATLAGSPSRRRAWFRSALLLAAQGAAALLLLGAAHAHCRCARPPSCCAVSPRCRSRPASGSASAACPGAHRARPGVGLLSRQRRHRARAGRRLRHRSRPALPSAARRAASGWCSSPSASPTASSSSRSAGARSSGRRRSSRGYARARRWRHGCSTGPGAVRRAVVTGTPAHG